ncbi:MAG: DUF2089 domain-containing protein [Anaerolineae bacterium]
MAHPMSSRCPVCGDTLRVSGLHCPGCDATITGQFDLGIFGRLSADQLAFAGLLVRCDGKITRVEQELGLCYPTVRNRLDALIRAPGYPARMPPRMSADEHRNILDRLFSSEPSPDEAVALLSVK